MNDNKSTENSKYPGVNPVQYAERKITTVGRNNFILRKVRRGVFMSLYDWTSDVLEQCWDWVWFLACEFFDFGRFIYTSIMKERARQRLLATMYYVYARPHPFQLRKKYWYILASILHILWWIAWSIAGNYFDPRIVSGIAMSIFTTFWIWVIWWFDNQVDYDERRKKRAKFRDAYFRFRRDNWNGYFMNNSNETTSGTSTTSTNVANDKNSKK